MNALLGLVLLGIILLSFRLSPGGLRRAWNERMS